MASICGPWRQDFHGGFRYRMCSGNSANAEPDPAPEPEITPAEPQLPARKTPPACERRVNTEHTNQTARKLIESVFGTSEGETS